MRQQYLATRCEENFTFNLNLLSLTFKIPMENAHNRPFVSPFVVIAFGILAVSTASVFIRFAQDHASSLVIAAYRLTLASIVLTPIAIHRHKSDLQKLSRRDFILGLISGAFLAIHFATWITSLEYTSVANSVVIVTTTPMWVALLAPLILRETLHRNVIAGLAVALLGGMIVGLSDACAVEGWAVACPDFSYFLQGNLFLGNTLALFGAWSAAGYLLIGRRLRGKMSLIPYIFLVYGFAALFLVGIMLAAGESPFGYPPATYLWFLLLALVPQLLGHSSFNWALGYLPAAFVSITLLGEPIGTIILAYLILDEIPGALNLFGAILILIGIYITSTQPKPQTT